MGKISSKIKAILFDMDGVIVDTEPVHEEARQFIYNKYSIPSFITNQVAVIGRNTDAIFADINKLFPFPVPLKVVINEKRDVFVSLLGNNTRPLLGVAETLAWANSNFLTALVTASAQKNVNAVLKSASLVGNFSTLVVAEDVKRWKPDPESYLLAAKRLNLKPEECIVIEDSPVGVEAAKAAQMKVIGVRTGQGGLEPKSANITINDLSKGPEEISLFIKEHCS